MAAETRIETSGCGHKCGGRLGSGDLQSGRRNGEEQTWFVLPFNALQTLLRDPCAKHVDGGPATLAAQCVDRRQLLSASRTFLPGRHAQMGFPLQGWRDDDAV